MPKVLRSAFQGRYMHQPVYRVGIEVGIPLFYDIPVKEVPGYQSVIGLGFQQVSGQVSQGLGGSDQVASFRKCD